MQRPYRRWALFAAPLALAVVIAGARIADERHEDSQARGQQDSEDVAPAPADALREAVDRLAASPFPAPHPAA